MEGLSAAEKEWISKLKSNEYGQQHLVEQLPAGATTERLRCLVSQIESLDSTYPGGLLAYIQRARKLLKESREGVNVFEGFVPQVPSGVSLTTGSDEFVRLEKLGLENLDKMSFVLVAGGLGERLGYPGIKIGLPVETTTMTTYCEFYIKTILAMQDYCKKVLQKDVILPLAIMTSGDTHTQTVKLLEENDNFGMAKYQITIMKQEKVPALLNADACIATSPEDPFSILTKPHGHGDVHTLLRQAGLVKKWQEEGRKYVLFFQDTNGVLFRCLPVTLGVSIEQGFCMNSITVPRLPKEAAGAICSLVNEKTGGKMTINVEYNLLDPLLCNTGEKLGDIAGPDGFSKFPGNINVLLFELEKYGAALDATGGAIPEFVNPKYKDVEKTVFKAPTRLECMMQDFAKMFRSDDKVGFIQLDRWLCFSPVKNNVKDAAVKAKVTSATECALTGESDQYSNSARLIELAAKAVGCPCEIADPEKVNYAGVDYKLGPRIVMLPSFAFCLERVKSHLGGGAIKIAQGASLVLDGDIRIDGLELNGALNLVAQKGSKLKVKNLRVHNKGRPIEEVSPDDDAVPAFLQIRGYKFGAGEITELRSE